MLRLKSTDLRNGGESARLVCGRVRGVVRGMKRRMEGICLCVLECREKSKFVVDSNDNSACESFLAMARLWPFFSTPFSSLPASPLLPVPIPLPTTKEAKDEGATLSVLNTLLEPFKGQDIPLAARSDPTLVQKEELPFTVSKIWQYVPFLASQGAYSLAQATPRLYA